MLGQSQTKKRKAGAMIPKYIQRYEDLVTSRKATVEGFFNQAIVKSDKATAMVEEAKALKVELYKIKQLEQALKNRSLRERLITASGISDKASRHLSASELDKLVLAALVKTCSTAGAAWRDEVVYRFLLTRGDTLGGIMRNDTGSKGGAKFTVAVLSALDAAGTTYKLKQNAKGKIQAVMWTGRTIFFDKLFPAIKRINVDVILVNANLVRGTGKLPSTKEAYLAFGELKGGIDPAGADEHWKTARTALERIAKEFTGPKKPHLFFAGAAIEKAMAGEIYELLVSGQLEHAANITVQEQLDDLAGWLVSL
jgi:hypothetical protein